MRLAKTVLVLALFSAVLIFPATSKADEAALTAELQRVVDAYVKDRASIEGLSGVALEVDRGAGARSSRSSPATMGSPTKADRRRHFVPDRQQHQGIHLRADPQARSGWRTQLDDTIGKWLPQYPAWKDVTIRALLQMTSPIPNYSETVAIGEIEVADIHHQFSGKDLIGFVDPANGHHFPPATGWFYSNTNYILAGLIIEAASGMNYEQALTTMILEPLGLHDTFYADGSNPGPPAAGPVMSRVPRALYLLQDCLGYQPEPCKVSTLAPLIGKDMRLQNRSWAAEAGAIISNPHDLGLWIRALFEKRVVPAKQLEEMTTLVSNKTGLPLPEVSADEPVGFGLGLGRFHRKELGGAYWFYEGETLGFRTIFAYWPQFDLLITGSVNSRPPNGEDKFGPSVIGDAFMALHEAHLIETSGTSDKK